MWVHKGMWIKNLPYMSKFTPSINYFYDVLFWLCKQKGIIEQPNRSLSPARVSHYKSGYTKECGLKIYRICPIRIEIIYGRGKFVGDFNMGSIICANFTQIMLPIFAQIMLPMLKSPTNLPLSKLMTLPVWP
jgi:hypothetical protein